MDLVKERNGGLLESNTGGSLWAAITVPRTSSELWRWRRARSTVDFDDRGEAVIIIGDESRGNDETFRILRGRNVILEEEEEREGSETSRLTAAIEESGGDGGWLTAVRV